MSDIIDLNERRNENERPDGAFIHRDESGREMFTFCLSYDLEGRRYGTTIIAYDWDDAQAKVSAMRESLRLDGQLFTTVAP